MDFSLIETFGYLPPEGFVRLEAHLSRMAQSAAHFGIAFDRRSIENELAKIAPDEPQRMRIELFGDGRYTLEAHPFAPLPDDAVWRVAVADTRLASNNVLLRHKTSRRAVYAAARAEFDPSLIDEVLLENEHGDVCEGTITSLFVRMDAGDPLLTPPLECGLLAGVLRAQAIKDGLTREARLTVSDLHDATEILVGNSLRGFIRAQLGNHQSPANV